VEATGSTRHERSNLFPRALERMSSRMMLNIFACPQPLLRLFFPPPTPRPPTTTIHTHRQHSQAFYAQVYAIIVGIMSVFGLLRMVGMALGALRAATQLHNGMVSALLRTTCRFYDLNPVGRIMNRCGVIAALAGR
jgi:ABC-type multidrug transport system fused ATPase/permease subunit